MGLPATADQIAAMRLCITKAEPCLYCLSSRRLRSCNPYIGPSFSAVAATSKASDHLQSGLCKCFTGRSTYYARDSAQLKQSKDRFPRLTAARQIPMPRKWQYRTIRPPSQNLDDGLQHVNDHEYHHSCAGH